MKKDAYYFSHDSNARRDPKMSALLRNFGYEGYGLWWCLIEIMHEQKGGKLEKFPKLYEGLAHELDHDRRKSKRIEAVLQALVNAAISDYHLLQEDATHIWSDRVIRNLTDRHIKLMKSIESGRLGGIESGKKRKRIEGNSSDPSSNEAKERKGKERKEKDNYIPVDSPKDGKPTATDLLKLWNAEAHPNLPRALVLTKTRSRHAEARLQEHPEQSFWQDVLSKVNLSPLLRGETGNWRASFDWILNPSNLVKIVEGNYNANR